MITDMLAYITWDMNPEFLPGLFENLPIHPRWYGVLFALGFIFGFKILEKIFKNENAPENWIDSIFIYVMIGTVVGARLGHVFFYGWDYYSQHPAEILMIWEGGLASHGATIGNIFVIWLWSKRVAHKNTLWTLDRVVITIALAGALIRLGNFFNSEIVGKPSDLPWAVLFKNSYEYGDVPRHPTQIYEALAYLIIFVVLYTDYWRRQKGQQLGYIFGKFLVLIFGFRFFVEFLKENQEAFEEDMALNMGQWLSIPLVIIGAYFMWASRKRPYIPDGTSSKGKG